MNSSVGLPRQSTMSWIMWLKLRPGKGARRPRISARMHPTAQMSTAASYMPAPQRSSGARYQRVTTYEVRSPSPPAAAASAALSSEGSSTRRPMARARPKSQTTSSQLALTSTFWGLRSLQWPPVGSREGGRVGVSEGVREGGGVHKRVVGREGQAGRRGKGRARGWVRRRRRESALRRGVRVVNGGATFRPRAGLTCEAPRRSART